MTGRALQICEETAANRELVEVRDLLRWLIQGGFVFLGFRRYLVTGDDGAARFELDPGTELGIMREHDEIAISHLGPARRTLARAPQALLRRAAAGDRQELAPSRTYIAAARWTASRFAAPTLRPRRRVRQFRRAVHLEGLRRGSATHSGAAREAARSARVRGRRARLARLQGNRFRLQQLPQGRTLSRAGRRIARAVAPDPRRQERGRGAALHRARPASRQRHRAGRDAARGRLRRAQPAHPGHSGSRASRHAGLFLSRARRRLHRAPPFLFRRRSAEDFGHPRPRGRRSPTSPGDGTIGCRSG